MARINTVELHAVIFHQLSPTTDPIFATEEIHLSGPDDPSATFFGNHIKNALNDGRARVAHFVDQDGVTCTSCMAILSDSSNFVPQSQLLAQKLLEAVSNYSGNISEGNVVFCLFSIEQSPQKHLAILKLDPSEIVRMIRKTGSHGAVFDFERWTDGLPPTSVKLQKCAFIEPPGSQSTYDLLVIDNQASAGAGPAKYFIGEFLEADSAFSDAQRTTRFATVIRNAQNKVRPLLKGDEDELLTQARYSVLSGPNIDVDKWIEQLPVRMEIRQGLLAEVQDKLQERVFNIDPKEAARRNERIVYKGEDGLRLVIQPSHIENGQVKIAAEEQDGQPTGYTIITIRQQTKEWKEVSR